MLQLPNVTLICVATRDHAEALTALLISSNTTQIEYRSIVFVTDVPVESFYNKVCDRYNFKYHIIDSFETIDDWNKFIFYDLHKYVDTEFCLLIHPDGYVINPDKWDDRFLQYDYIGAPWPADTIHDVYGNEVRVGNSISIRSKRLLELPSKLNLPWAEYNGSFNEDTQICAHYRPYFIGAGMNFAPVEIAALFSHEIPVPETEGIVPFAFHQWEPAAPKFKPFNLSDVYIEYINLDSRPDRNEHMINELNRVGLFTIRRTALLPDDLIQTMPKDKYHVIYTRTKGALGCWYSQVATMQEALQQNKHAWVQEDDLVYCDDLQERLQIITEFCSNHDWDIIWLGGTYHNEPTWHKSVNRKHTHPDLQMCTCELNCDWEPTENPYIVRTYGAWSTYSYIVNKDRIQLILEMLENNIYRSMGIDWAMILFQPQLLTYAFNPGCVKQFDNQSNIGDGITQFSIFENLGSHWFKNKL